MEGWSEARKRAYILREKNPNAYYYRFNDPGEKQRNGKWTKEEISLFYKRMDEVGVNGQWGVFSRAIPGRVGYQCSNFYRFLIETSQIKDDNYVLDATGKARYLHRTRKAKGVGENATAPVKSAPTLTKPKKRTKKKGKKKRQQSEGEEGEGEDDDDDDEYRPTKKKKGDGDSDDGSEDVDNSNNPLPDFIDPIMNSKTTKPALSPYGHVLDYSTWSRILSQESSRNICPFTKQTLKKRDLILLTWENIDQYIDKILNLKEISDS